MSELTPLRLLQFGATGQLARELTSAAAARAGKTLNVVPRSVADFSRPDEIVRAVNAGGDVDAVINATGYTMVDKAETEEALAYRINAEAVGALGRACAARGVPLIHVSSDYVFDGTKREPYDETDAPHPLNAYGRSKLAGERQIQEATDLHVIVRTSWLFSAHGANFVKTMLRLGKEREELRVVDDQFGAPTSAADLAEAILRIAGTLAAGGQDAHYGTFHYSGAGVTTWRGFADAIVTSAAGWAGSRAWVTPIATVDYATPARRPCNSALDCSKIGLVFGIEPVPWTAALDRVLLQLECERRENSS